MFYNIIFINCFHYARRLCYLGDWVASKWKDLVDQFQKKEKSGDKGQTIEEKNSIHEALHGRLQVNTH